MLPVEVTVCTAAEDAEPINPVAAADAETVTAATARAAPIRPEIAPVAVMLPPDEAVAETAPISLVPKDDPILCATMFYGFGVADGYAASVQSAPPPDVELSE